MGVRILDQGPDALEALRHREAGVPSVLQDVQASVQLMRSTQIPLLDLQNRSKIPEADSAIGVHVAVVDRRLELDLRGLEWIVLKDIYLIGLDNHG